MNNKNIRIGSVSILLIGIVMLILSVITVSSGLEDIEDCYERAKTLEHKPSCEFVQEEVSWRSLLVFGIGILLVTHGMSNLMGGKNEQRD